MAMKEYLVGEVTALPHSWGHGLVGHPRMVPAV